MLKVKIDPGHLSFQDSEGKTRLTIRFHRTLRIPDDGRDYPLPPSLGGFPLERVLDYRERVPTKWVGHSGVFLPMYQREALWIQFDVPDWRPCAVKVAAGKVNAVSGEVWDQALLPADERAQGLQDYMVCPPQPWLDGFNTGEGTIRQFIAMPLGMGYTVEAQVTGDETHGGVQVIVYEPRPGQFPEPPPDPFQDDRFSGGAAAPPGAVFGGGVPTLGGGEDFFDAMGSADPFGAPAGGAVPAAGAEMGLGGGGTMEQKIYDDPHGYETWDPEAYGRVYVHIVNSQMYREITGNDPPPSPISAATYTEMGYPWFEVYDEGVTSVGPSKVLGQVQSIKEMDAKHGFMAVQDDSGVEIPEDQIKGGLPRDEVPDGDW